MMLTGKTALVTGSARGLGRAYALHLARLGADVVVTDINLSGAARIGEDLTAETVMAEIEALGRRALGVQGDLRDADFVAALFAETEAAFGGLDILVNNAGVAVARNSGPLPSETTPEGYSHIMDSNMRTTLLCSQQAARLMRKRRTGSIVNVASQCGLAPLKGGSLGVYAAAKAAVAAYTRNLAAELGPDGIRVNAVAPGIIETARVRKLPPGEGVGTAEQLEAVALRRWGQPEDVAEVVTFLVSDKARYVTGQIISVCGGAVLTPH